MIKRSPLVFALFCREILEVLLFTRTGPQVGFNSAASLPGEMAVEKRANLVFTHGFPPTLTGLGLKYNVSSQKKPHRFIKSLSYMLENIFCFKGRLGAESQHVQSF